MASKSEALQVYVRVRPPIYKEVKQDVAVNIKGTTGIGLSHEKGDVDCTYDRVFNELTEQEEVFEKVKPLLVDVLSGVNACIFAYGQTSAGKSYTMIGPNGGQDIFNRLKDDWGILPRASEFLLGYLNEKSDEGQLTYEVKASFLQIYNENLYDLLRDTGPMIEEKLLLHEKDKEHDLRIREVPLPKSRANRGPGGGISNEVYVSGLSEFRVQTSEDILRILAVGTNNRMTRSTDFNKTSSRSHALLQLTFEIESHTETGQTVINRSKLNLIDLAGSEKIPFAASDLSSNAKHMKELTSINKSLSSLGNVISALASNNRSHIPYRDSKLTRILQDSLSGNTRTILIACVAPTVQYVSETLSTLQFADRAKNVMLTVKPNTLVDDKFLLAKAHAEITRLKTLLAHALKQVDQLKKSAAKSGGGGGGGEAGGGSENGGSRGWDGGDGEQRRRGAKVGAGAGNESGEDEDYDEEGDEERDEDSVTARGRGRARGSGGGGRGSRDGGLEGIALPNPSRAGGGKTPKRASFPGNDKLLDTKLLLQLPAGRKLPGAQAAAAGGGGGGKKKGFGKKKAGKKKRGAGMGGDRGDPAVFDLLDSDQPTSRSPEAGKYYK